MYSAGCFTSVSNTSSVASAIAANGEATAKTPKAPIVAAVPRGLTRSTSPNAAQPRSTFQSQSSSQRDAVPESASAKAASEKLTTSEAMSLFIILIYMLFTTFQHKYYCTFMADTTISQLTTVNALTATNYIPISDGINTTKLGTDSLFGFRNKITNGDMRIDQYYNGGLINANAGILITPGIDRWQINNVTSTANLTMQRVLDAPAGFNYSLKISVNDAQTSYPSNNWSTLRHWMNGSNFSDLAYGTSNAKPVTLSFWVKSSVLGNFPINFYIKSNSSTNSTYNTTFSINSVNKWEYKIITIPGNTVIPIGTGEQYVGLRFPFGAGSDYYAPSLNTWYNNLGYNSHSSATIFNSFAGATINFTGIQLEIGNIATPFEPRPYGLELQECQRYLLVIGNNNNGYAPFATGYIRNANTALYMRQMSPYFAMAPALSANPGAFIIDDGNIQTPTSITLDRYCDGTIMFYASVTNNSLTTGRGSILYSNPAGTGRLIFYTGF